MAKPALTAKIFSQPLDRIALTLMVLLSVAIAVLLLSGDRTSPRVRTFTWQDKQVGVEDTAFVLAFSRPMDHVSVESNLKIDPPLPGKISWAGRRMAYTLLSPAPYGIDYKLQLQNAQGRAVQESANQAPIQPFTAGFRTRDRAFAYIGVSGEEEGRLILVNFSDPKPKPVILTPKHLIVVDFKPYPTADRILFSAIERKVKKQGFVEQKLYTVTTGIHPDAPDELGTSRSPFLGLFGTQAPATEAPGKIDLVLDNQDYQNLKFDLSANGQVIVVQRVNRRNAADSAPWILRPDAKPQPLDSQAGGDFLLTPDSDSLAIAQGQGLAILPLQPNAEPLDFLPKFGMVLSFTRDGSAAAMVKFNADYTRSLFLVNNQGVQKELLKTTGSILSAQFDPTRQTLYCLLTQLIPGNEYQEQPFLAAVDLQTSKLMPLLILPIQRDIQMSLSPDGLALLFDQTLPESANAQESQSALRTSDGKAIATSRLWLLPLAADPETQAKLQPESLPLQGFHPRWLP